MLVYVYAHDVCMYVCFVSVQVCVYHVCGLRTGTYIFMYVLCAHIHKGTLRHISLFLLSHHSLTLVCKLSTFLFYWTVAQVIADSLLLLTSSNLLLLSDFINLLHFSLL